MLTNTLTTNKVVLSNSELKELGFKKEKLMTMDEGFYQVHSITKGDRSIEVVNEFNSDKVLFHQYTNTVIVMEQSTNYTKEDLKVLIKYVV